MINQAHSPIVDLAARFESVARAAPDNSALISADGVRTYRDVDADADAIAVALAERGGGPGSVIGVALPNGPGLVASLLGVLKAGGTYLGLDHEGPAARTRTILADAAARVLIAPPRVHHVVAANTAIDPAAVLGATRPRERERTGGPVPGRIAYICSTSGSTGVPNSVAMPMRAFVNLLDWELDRMRARARAHGEGQCGDRQHRVLHFARPTFDVSPQEILSTLLAGDCLVTAEEPLRRDPRYLVELIREYGVERAYVPPMVLGQLAHAGFGLGGQLKLWEFVVAGGVLHLPAEVRQFLATLDRPVVDDQYGTTEVHTAVARMLNGSPLDWPDRISFTDEVTGLSVSIVDRDLREVGEGDGEVVIRGEYLSRGYVGRPALTAARFLPDPHAARPGARMYRTGDLGCRRSDGSVEIKGRLDDQVNLRGQRIALGEVEHALTGLPGVAGGCVLSQGDGERARLIGYVVPEQHGVPVADGYLRQELARRLPSYMIPDTFIMVDDLPLNRHGKVDRGRLRLRQEAGVDETSMTGYEAAVAHIWSSTLEAWIEGPRAHFFQCGGNSVLATAVIARMRRYFAKDLPFDLMFRTPVLADVARAIESAPDSDEPRLGAAPRNRHVPVSAAQLRLWFQYRLDPDLATYNVTWAWRATGPVWPDALHRAVRELTERHEALRTVICAMDDGSTEVVQRVLAHCPDGYFQVVDLTGVEDAADAIEHWRSLPFDLERGPLHRTCLLSTGENEWVVLFTGHHIILDGWSDDIVRRELSVLYGTHVRGDRIADLPTVAVQYRDFAVWQREYLRSAAVETQAGYWRARLHGAPAALPLPLERAPGTVTDSAAGHHVVRLSAADSTAVREVAVREAATPAVVLLASYGLALSSVSGATDIVVGIPASGRVRVGLENCVGFFVNSLPIRMDLSGAGPDGDAFAVALAEVKESMLGAVANQDVPFDEIVRIVAPRRLAGRNPIFQVWFAYDDPPVPLRLAGTETSELRLPETRARFDLALHVRHDAPHICAEFTYRSSLLSGQTVSVLAERFGGILASLRSATQPLEEAEKAGARR